MALRRRASGLAAELVGRVQGEHHFNLLRARGHVLRVGRVVDVQVLDEPQPTPLAMREGYPYSHCTSAGGLGVRGTSCVRAEARQTETRSPK